VAERLLVPEAWSAAYSRTTACSSPLPAGEVLAKLMTDRERRLVTEAPRGQIRGTEADVARELGGLVTTSTFDRADMLDPCRRLAGIARPLRPVIRPSAPAPNPVPAS
jgi:hypothetical protein